MGIQCFFSDVPNLKLLSNDEFISYCMSVGTIKYRTVVIICHVHDHCVCHHAFNWAYLNTA
jgi:hypothetical protein